MPAPVGSDAEKCAETTGWLHVWLAEEAVATVPGSVMHVRKARSVGVSASRSCLHNVSCNRIAVPGANIPVVAHLTGLLLRYVRLLRMGLDLQPVDEFTARYLMVYGIWPAFVTFLFPLKFGFA